jgi:hypothetical protein
VDIDPAMVQALADNSADLQGTEGVNGFDVGLDDSGELVLRIMVADPANPPDDLPTSLGGFPVLVIEGAPITLSGLPDEARYSPVVGGVQIAQASAPLAAPSGTLGIVMRDLGSGDKVGISAGHVMAGVDPLAIFSATEIWQPNALGQRLGGLLRWDIPSTPALDPADPRPSGLWDYAVCSVDRDATVGEIAEIGAVTGIASPGPIAVLGGASSVLPREHVRKRGFTTGLTEGFVDGFGSYLVDDTRKGWWVLGQTRIRGIPTATNPGGGFCDGGDSGSVVVNDAGEIVGLLHAGFTGATANVGIMTDFAPLAVTMAVGL